MKDRVGFIADEERPTVMHVHGGVVGHADVARDFRVVEDAAEVDDGVIELQIREENLPAEADTVHVGVLLSR